MEFLKPKKANVLGTLTLLVANWISDLISRSVMGLFIAEIGPPNMPVSASMGAFKGNAMRMGNNLLGGVVNIIILALLFYITLSFVLDYFSKEEKKKAK